MISIYLPLDSNIFSQIKEIIKEYTSETFDLIFDLRYFEKIKDMDDLVRNTNLDQLEKLMVVVASETLKYYFSGRLKKAQHC